jgi:gamma-glutamylcyclotransferase (GGCT)/AIG2-like uncharacterized protein YtfP
MIKHLLFVYGTLIEPETQQEVLGRTTIGTPDELADYAAHPVIIEGMKYTTIKSNAGSKITGWVITLGDEDLAAIDKYETSAYTRIKVRLVSGAEAWAYVEP